MEEEFKNLNHEQIIEKINNKFPNWIEDICDNYRSDYPHLISNWNVICEKLDTKCAKILLVSNLPHPNEKNINKELLQYSDMLIKLGYVVRRSTEFNKCENTNNIIPTEDLYNYMINVPELKSLLPEKWIKNL